MNFIFPINGARAFPEVETKVTDEDILFKMPEVNNEYSFGLLTNEMVEDGSLMLLCAKENKIGVIAFTVIIKDTEYSQLDFRKMSLQTFFNLVDPKEVSDA